MFEKIKNLLFGQPQISQQSEEPSAEDISIMRLNNLRRMNFQTQKAFFIKHKDVIVSLRSTYALDPITGDQRIEELCKAFEHESYPTVLANAKHVYGVGSAIEDQWEKTFYKVLFANLKEDYRATFLIESESQG